MRAAQLIAENRYLVTNDPISNMRVSIIKEAISHLGGVPHVGALKPALVSQLAALNAGGLSSLTAPADGSPENTPGDDVGTAMPPNIATLASYALTIISDHVDAPAGDLLVPCAPVCIPASSPPLQFCSGVNEAWVVNAPPSLDSPGFMQVSLLTMMLGVGCSPGFDNFGLFPVPTWTSVCLILGGRNPPSIVRYASIGTSPTLLHWLVLNPSPLWLPSPPTKSGLGIC